MPELVGNAGASCISYAWLKWGVAEMNAMTPVTAGAEAQASATQIEGQLSELIRRDVATLRKPQQISDHGDAAVSQVYSVIGRVSAASVKEIEKLVAELENSRVIRLVPSHEGCRRQGRTQRTARRAPRPDARRGRSPDSRLAPFGLALHEADERHVGALGPVDRLDGRQDRLAVIPGHKCEAVADQVHDADLRG
jgi:hypothetical protein